MPKFPHQQQPDSFDCGPTCLQMIAQFYGKKYTLDFLREQCYITRNGVSMLGISTAAESIGFKTMIIKTDIETLINECPLPIILHWHQNHFVVLYKVKKHAFFSTHKKDITNHQFLIADPAFNLQYINYQTFAKSWCNNDNNQGIAMLLEPQAQFYNQHIVTTKNNPFKTLFQYLIPFKTKIINILLFILISMGIALCFPFISQQIVDRGINKNNNHLILLFVLAQLVLFCSDTVISIIRNRLLLRVNAKISLHIVSNFLKKLLSLPIRFFDSKSIGDVTQRIQDHQRIQQFLTGDLINSAFAIVELFIYSILLFYYQINIGLVFVFVSLTGVMWIFQFQKKRARLDYMLFNQHKIYQEKLHELVIGMQEIKLFGSENSKRWEWEFIQQKLFKLNITSLTLSQWQQTGFVFFSYLKNIIITYLTAIAVINGKLSLGTMLSISYIIGATNSPLELLVSFFKSAQDANLSLQRLEEVQQKTAETTENDTPFILQNNANIVLNKVCFQYNGPRSSYVLKDIDFTIQPNKITAIVGESGSGKTTLMKLLLGFYKPVSGEIKIQDKSIFEITPAIWRSYCGTVMQDGYIFFDTIEKNIALDGKEIDKNKFIEACTIANVNEFVSNLPLGYKTLIGSSGMGLSGGQKQRILIARAVYKNPQFIFFDEATSSLDANNEQQIMQQLLTYFKNKTVLIIAHRLSTVKNADEIIVLEKGEIIERGNHHQLVQLQGNYFNLVKNQLALGND